MRTWLMHSPGSRLVPLAAALIVTAAPFRLHAQTPDGRAELERDVNAMLDPRVRAVENPDPSRGMFSSIQEGVAQAEGDAILVMPGDMPFISPDSVRAVIAAFEREPSIVSPRYRGKRGHPVALPASLRDEIRAARPAATLHDVIHAHMDMRVDVDTDDPGVVRDIDRPEDLTRS